MAKIPVAFLQQVEHHFHRGLGDAAGSAVRNRHEQRERQRRAHHHILDRAVTRLTLLHLKCSRLVTVFNTTVTWLSAPRVMTAVASLPSPLKNNVLPTVVP